MTSNLEIAIYFWRCDTAEGKPWRLKIVRWFDHAFLTGWRYRRHVRTWRKPMKSFSKTPEIIVTVLIEEDGSLTYIKTDSADIFMSCGKTITRRASHVEPATFWSRAAFHILRRFVSDKSRIAAWTRRWGCAWRINTAPIGGPILKWKHTNTWRARAFPEHTAKWMDRQEAIDAEIIFLNAWFAERGMKVR